MKIAFVCTEKLPVPPVSGGAVQIYIDGVVPHLAKSHDITVFCVENPLLPNEEVKENVRYIRVPAKSKSNYLNNVKARLTKDFELIHIFNRPLWVSSIGNSFPGTMLSLSLHNEMFLPDKISADEALNCINRVEFINTVSRFIADGVVHSYPAASGKMNVVYSGVDIAKYTPNWSDQGYKNKLRLKAKYNILENKVILFVGRLSVKKGVHTLFNAMKQVMENSPKAALVIIGSKWFGENTGDEYTRHLEELSKELKGPIVFTGFLPPSEVSALYNMGDIFVCPSQWNEPLARVHYEAMAAGLPIITTNRGGNAEVIIPNHNGIVINDYKNPNAFAECINYLLDNPDKALEMGVNGRKLAEEKYGWSRVANDILAPITKLQNQPRRYVAPVNISAIKPSEEKKSHASEKTEIDYNFFNIDF